MDACTTCSSMYSGEAAAVSATSYTSPSTTPLPIFLDQLHCNGDETLLLECDYFADLGLHMCDHSQDVGVFCECTYVKGALLSWVCIVSFTFGFTHSC